MSEELSLSEPVSGGFSRSFWLRRLHSLSGVVPIGAFLLEHIWSNSYSLQGPEAYNNMIKGIMSLPYVVYAEIFMIALPILFHALYGLVISAQGQPNNLRFTYGRNWLYLFQRITGVVLLAYIGLHVYETRIEAALTQNPVTFDRMVHELSEPGMFAFYIIGVLAACFHFANGFWAFLIAWGITASARAQRYSAFACTLMGVVLSYAGIKALTGFFRF